MIPGITVIEIRHVLCAVDFSDASRRALDHAIAIATWYRAHLTVTHVRRVPLVAIGLSLPATTEEFVLSAAARDQMRELAAFMPAGATPPVRVAFRVAEGDAAAGILVQAETADLVVIGTHGRSGYQHLLLGSVADKVVRGATCPVLTIPPGAAGAPGAVSALFHQVVAAVDLSPASLHALAFAASLAEQAGGRLTVLRVLELPREMARWAAESGEGQAQVQRWQAEALAGLRVVVGDAARLCPHVQPRIGTGQPYRVILAVAAEQQAGLIVLGAHGHGVAERMFVGSTAQHVVRHAVCPVLTLRHAY